MARVKRMRSAISIGLWAVSMLVIASAAGAYPNFGLSGKLQQYCCNWPNGGRPGFLPASPTLIKINDFPFAGGGGGVTLQRGHPGPVATVMGTAMGKLTIPASAIKVDGLFLNTHPVFPGWVSIFTNVHVRNEAGTLLPGGQTGTRAYCLNFAGNPNCTDPAVGTVAGGTFNALLSFKAGPNQFGGTMRLLGGTPGYLKRTTGGPGRIRLGSFAAPLTQIGGPFSEYKPQINTAFFWPATFTVQNPSNATATNMDNIMFAGIPWGTGTIYAGRTGGTGAIPTQSISGMGADNRTTMSGGGNISLVAASVSGVNNANAFPILIRLDLNVPEPGTTLMYVSGMGFLALLGVWKHRSRLAKA